MRALALAALLLPCLAGIAHADGESSTYQVNAAHDGVARTTLPSSPSQLWSRDDLGGLVSYPLVARGKVFVTVMQVSGGPVLYALDQRTGATVWTHTVTSSTRLAGAAYDDGRIYVQAYDGLLRALDADTGGSLWSRQLPGQYAFTSPPVAIGGYVYTGGAGSGGTVYAVHHDTGALQWSRSVANGDHSSPAVVGGTVFVNYTCPQVYAFGALTGAAAWSYSGPCSGGGGRTMAVHGGRAYARMFFSASGGVFDAATGSLLRQATFGPIPAFGGGKVLFISNGTLRAEDPATGVQSWSTTTPATIEMPPVTVGDRAFVASSNGTIVAKSLVDGSQSWSAPLGSVVSAPDEHNARVLSGMGAGEGVLAVSATNRLVAFGCAGDADAPSAPTLTTTSRSTTGRPTVQWTASSDTGCGLSHYAVLVDGRQHGNDVLAGTTTWTAFAGLAAGPNRDLPEGAREVRVRAVDLAGNTALSEPITLTVDTTYPVVTIDGGPSSTTTDTSASFSVATTEGSLECVLDDGAWHACGVPEAYAGLADGQHRLLARATDAVGNTTTVTRWWTIDTALPDTTITSGPSGTVGSREATFDLQSDAAHIRCRIDAGAWEPCGGSRTYSDLPDGPHTFSAYGVDDAGNADPTPATRTWTVDASDPDTTITAFPAANSTATTATFAFASSKAGATYACWVDHALVMPCANPLHLTGLAQGTHSLEVFAIDRWGHSDPTGAIWTWSIDSVRPVVSLQLPTTSLLTAAPVTLLGAVTDPGGPAPTTVTVGYAGPASGTACTATTAVGTWSCTWDVTALPPGAYALTATTLDAAGNAGSFVVGVSLAAAGGQVTATTPTSTPPTATEPTSTTPTRGADTIAGTSAGNTIRALAGNDTVHAGAGADLVYGGFGADRLFGQLGNDRLRGDAGADLLDGGPGNDHLLGGPGRDTLLGGAGLDVIDARDRRPGDTIRCGAGRDVVYLDPGDRRAADCERVRR